MQGLESLRFPQFSTHILLRAEIVKFREMMDNRVRDASGPLTTIPDENKPLIVKLAQER